jgi:Holliday junction resolvase RusA-like endonuclease
MVGGFARMYSPNENRTNKKHIQSYAASAMALHNFYAPIEGPVVLSVEMHFPWPKSRQCKRLQNIRGDKLPLKIWPAKRPDADNVLKILQDSLNGVVFVDDKQIVELHVGKFYTTDNPRSVITLSRPTFTRKHAKGIGYRGRLDDIRPDWN